MVEIGGVSLLTAFFAGAISFLSPCVLPLVPGYLSAVTGVAAADLEEASWRKVVPPSLTFIASFSSIFILLGLSATGISQVLRTNLQTLNKVAGVLIIAMGIFFIATLFLTKLNAEWRVDALMERAGKGGPIVAGAAFAIAWTPCVGPTLAAILGLASTSTSVWQGGVMLAVYSLGLAVPFLLTAIGFTRMTTAFAVVKRHYSQIMAFGGAVLIVMGVLVFTGELFRLNIEAQQWLDGIGLNFFNDV
ncbi:MAG: cytochrome c biogenesis protein CcdA [Thermoleophilia bacterium]|jgi:cytochrome c-type biogenesis protein|nr:cytochrome c biogenesis protein CcdA [Thermoleophilia bacterium]